VSQVDPGLLPWKPREDLVKPCRFAAWIHLKKRENLNSNFGGKKVNRWKHLNSLFSQELRLYAEDQEVCEKNWQNCPKCSRGSNLVVHRRPCECPVDWAQRITTRLHKSNINIFRKHISCPVRQHHSPPLFFLKILTFFHSMGLTNKYWQQNYAQLLLTLDWINIE